jgi:ketosteroid isomerase-like protein
VADRLIEITRDVYDAFNRGDTAAIMERMDADLVVYDRDRTGTEHHGPEGWRHFTEEWLESWDEYSVEIKRLTRNGDKVLVDLLQSGVGKGSGIAFSEPFAQVLTFDGEKVVRFEIFVELEDAERAAGLRD